MSQIIRVRSAADLDGGELIPGAARLTSEQIARDAPQETWILRDTGGRLDAHASIWWQDAAVDGDRRIGWIGHYAARDLDDGRQLLQHVSARLAAQGCTDAAGPADGGLWRPHGLVTERGAERVFLFDLSHPEEWPQHFRAAGFTPAVEYVSTAVDLSAEEPRLQRATQRMGALGVRLRRFRLARVDYEFKAMHTVLAAATASDPLASSMPVSRFLDFHRLLVAFLDPQHVILAEHDNRLVGFVFSAPDINERAWGKPQRTLVVRTVATVPDRVFEGLDIVLRAEAHRIGRLAGFERAIYRCLPAAVASRPSPNGVWPGQPIRRYALFGRRVAQ
jgi:hypothetical protein